MNKPKITFGKIQLSVKKPDAADETAENASSTGEPTSGKRF